MRHLLTSLSLLFLLIPASSAQTQNSQTTLQPGTPIERTIGPNESHTYTITLGAEQYFQFVVNQHGIDLIVRVFSPSGKSLGDFDSPNGSEGPENVSAVAITSGAYRIVVAPLDSHSVEKPGRYEIKILEVRDATDQELTVGKNEEARKAKGLALLNDIVNSIPEIRQPQTRIRVKLQSATLLWTVDEKKAARLLTEAVTDARDYLLGVKPDDDSYDEAAQWVQQIRFEAVQTLASRDPEAALSLLRSTRKPLNPETDRGEREPERQLELSLASQIAARNPQRAFEIAEDSLKDGFSNTLTQTLTSLSQVNPDLAGTLAKDITAKLLNTRFSSNPEAVDVTLDLLRHSVTGSGSDNNKTPNSALLSEQDYRALVQKAVREALAATATDNGFRLSEKTFSLINTNGVMFSVADRGFVMKGNTVETILRNIQELLGSQLDNIVPGGTAAIEKKLKELGGGDSGRESWAEYEKTIAGSSPETAREVISRAPAEIKDQLLQNLAEERVRSGNLAEAQQLIAESATNPRSRRQALNNLERQAAYTDLNQGRIEEALKHISKVSNTEERADILTEIASRIGPGQKRTQALALLETARSILGTSLHAAGQPEMRALLELASAFSRYDSKRGFEILEPLVDQFNDLSEAARTINGFGPQYFVDDELSMQNGNSVANIALQLAKTLGILSLADFDRAKTTSDRLHLPEVRLTVHLGIVQQAIMPNGIYSPSVANLNSLNR